MREVRENDGRHISPPQWEEIFCEESINNILGPAAASGIEPDTTEFTSVRRLAWTGPVFMKLGSNITADLSFDTNQMQLPPDHRTFIWHVNQNV